MSAFTKIPCGGAQIRDCVAVFDSGIGGLNILRELRRRHPRGRYVYLADGEFFPYGRREPRLIEGRLRAVLERFRSARALVIACNTASAVYAQTGIVAPGVFEIIGLTAEHACRLSKNRRIGVIATDLTVSLGGYREALLRLGAAPLEVKMSELVELIEGRGAQSEECYKSALDSLLCERLSVFRDSGIDTLICGCTHFGYIVGDLRRHLGDINYVVSDTAAARYIEKRISFAWDKPPLCKIYTTGDPAEFSAKMRSAGLCAAAEQLLGL